MPKNPRCKHCQTVRWPQKTDEFKQRLQGGETLDDLLPEAFAVVREVSVRTLKMRHFDVQLIAVLFYIKVKLLRCVPAKVKH